MRKIRFVLTTIVAMMFMVACGGNVEVDTTALTEKLVADVEFTEELEKMSEEDIEFYMDLEEGVSAIMYTGSAESGEQVGALTAEDEETAMKMKETVEALLKDQAEVLEPYEPEASKRIEKAIIKQKGNYVVFCVTDDLKTAQNIIKEAFGE